MGDNAELAAFHAEAAQLEQDLADAKARRLELKAAGRWEGDEREEVLAALEAASIGLNDFRSYWRKIGGYVAATTAAEGPDVDVPVDVVAATVEVNGGEVK